MKELLIALCLFGWIGLYGNQLEEKQQKSIQLQISEVKQILEGGEWKPVDQAQYNRLKELITYIETRPIDSVLNELNTDLDTSQLWIKREWQNIAEANKIEGYIRAWEINNSLINLEKKAANDLVPESIIVPEDEFVGMYAKIPLITAGNIQKLLTDSLITLPDSLQELKEAARQSHAYGKIREADSLITHYLEDARKIYNLKLVTAYRDSVITNYRANALQTYTDQLKKQYTDSVTRHNLKILKAYNDSVSLLVNDDFARRVEALIKHVNHTPYELNIINIFNEASTVKLQNDTIWYQWVWLKNAQNDSIGLRFENIDKHHVRVFVDEMVNLSRITQRESKIVDKVHLDHQFDQKLTKVAARKPELSPWKLGGKVYSGFTQTYINDYWSKGGNSSASALATFAYDINYSKEKLKWENGIDAKLGLIYYMPDEGTTAPRNWHKNSDNVEINSRLGFSAFKEWFYSAEVNFKTQFFLGFKSNNDEVPNSSIMSPAYLTFSGGFDFKPNKKISTFLSPLSIKTTYVLNPEVNEKVFGLEEGETRRTRLGMSGKLDYADKIIENISLKTRNSVFINFGRDNEGELQLFKIPDFDTETTLDFKVNQFISTQVNLHLIYDKDVESKWTDDSGADQSGTRLQVKEFLTIGISFKF
ncbi:MAG: DUF3078 domain-containing protein [Prolixibacteraceae bacterium]|nr:DUF3078 domain-containing protein [Prolixibacteraceae bacterium]